MRVLSWRFLTLSALWAGVFLFPTSYAKASSIQFATFDVIDADQPLSWTNNGGTSGDIVVDQADVSFSFTNQSGYPSTYDATLSIYGSPSTFTPATPGIVDVQPIDGPVTMTITNNAVAPNQPGYNLLTAVFQNGNLFGVDGSTNGSLAAEDNLDHETVTYTSDYGTFSSPGNNFNLGLNTLSAPISMGPGGFLNSFEANVNGQFSAANFSIHGISVPEPGSLGLCLAGLASMAFLWRRTRASR